jgi:hypothetical protein
LGQIIPLRSGVERVDRTSHEEAEVRILARAFARLDKVAFGLAAGLVSGTMLFAATAWLLVKGGPVVGPYLSLLGQIIPGYSVSWLGAAVGLFWGFAGGFAVGWAFALAKNLYVTSFLRHARFHTDRSERRRFLDSI